MKALEGANILPREPELATTQIRPMNQNQEFPPVASLHAIDDGPDLNPPAQRSEQEAARVIQLLDDLSVEELRAHAHEETAAREDEPAS